MAWNFKLLPDNKPTSIPASKIDPIKLKSDIESVMKALLERTTDSVHPSTEGSKAIDGA